MRRNPLLNRGNAVIVIVLFILASFIPNITGLQVESPYQIDTVVADVCDSQENVLVTCNTFGFPGEPSQEITMSLNEAEVLYDKIKELQIEVARDPLSDKTQQLQHEIITLADEQNLLPAGLSVKKLKSRLTPTLRPQHHKLALPRLQNKASEMFCNYVSTGSGSALPIIILPRLIPIFLTPIPRLFVRWSTLEGVTSCGGLRSGTGFIAYGAQNGIALGFWGIGFSIFLPPVMAYGLFGYALFASVNAEEIEWWPPNNPPVISNENPSSGTWNVPVSLSELSFQIEDGDGDPMSYSVTTSPDIGSGSGTNKGDGIYTVSVSGLKSNTQYQWVVEVTDGKDVTMKELSFMTEELPFDPFDEGWQYRKKITIDHIKIAGDLTNFPVLISTVDSDLRDKTQDGGDDVLFMDDIGVSQKLYHEIEHYDDSSGELVAWVNIPSVSDDEDTVFYLYYGNSGCSSQQVPEKVWDPNYCGVWHLETLSDSTNNDYDFSNNGASSGQTGKIGHCYGFDSSHNEHLSHPTLLDNGYNKLTVEIWFKRTFTDDYRYIISKENVDGDNRFGITIQSYNLMRGFVKGSGINAYSESSSYVAQDEWYYGALVYSSGNPLRVYLNNDYTTSDSSPGDILAGTYKNLVVACVWDIKYFFDGYIDEIRISNIARSGGWVATTYNNQNDPSSFVSFGPEEAGP